MKKLCQTCGALDETDALTCPNDGEASWVPVEEPADEPAVDDTAKPKKKAAK